MCGIAGFFHAKENFSDNTDRTQHILDEMNATLTHRGPDEAGTYLSAHFGLAHRRLSIIDLTSGQQPMLKKIGGSAYGIVYNGEIYNTAECRNELIDLGWKFETTCDTEVILAGHIEFGPDFVKKLNGIFAYAFMNEKENSILLVRDRFGVKPLFYSFTNETLVFASEIKGIFAYPSINPQIDRNGLNEIFGIGPAKTYGCGVFKGIEEILPGSFLLCQGNDLVSQFYWKLESHPHEDTYEKTIDKTAFFVRDSIRRQMISDVPICTFLSGGVDSSLVSSVCAQELKKCGKQLHTFSFDFVDNNVNFRTNAFQPSLDRPYVEKMAAYLDSKHTFLECDNQNQADFLYDSVDARDLPAMADIDSSLLYFCSLVAKDHKVTLTGECADEIFGGYPWFHKKECFEANTFPWTMDLSARKVLLKDDFLSELKMDEYVAATYEKSLAEAPRLAEDTKEEARRREISYLNLKWFMQTLLDRMDRTSMYSGLEARVPFADHRIVEYVFNVPWNMKSRQNVVKSLLRESSRNLLPDEILFRKKSPYPKTYDTNYETLLKERFVEVLSNPSSPILQFIDQKKADAFLHSPSDYGKPWYGQLMAGPQMLAYMIQVNYWLEKFHIQIL